MKQQLQNKIDAISAQLAELEQQIDYYEIDGQHGQDAYNDMLDEVYESVNVCGYDYRPSYALRELDPIAYNCGYSDWIANMDEDEKAMYDDDFAAMLVLRESLQDELAMLQDELDELDDEQ